MLKKINRLVNGEIAIGFFCAGLFWMALLGLATSYLPTTAEKEDCYQAAAKSGRNTGDCESFWERTTSDPVATFTLVLAFSTVGLWVATLALYRAGERHSERELRAYIVATVQAEIRNFHIATPTVVLGFVNAGQTPAHDVRLWTTSAVAVFPMEKRPTAPARTPDVGDSVGVIGPAGSFHSEHVPETPVTPAERQAVVEGRCAYFVYGELAYTDAFGRERHTSFCHFYRGEAARRQGGPLASYHKWNEAS
jgi:hypothetical protein